MYDIQTVNGHYLTAVGGGGRTTDTIHSDATRVGSWEKFTVSCGHERGSLRIRYGVGAAGTGISSCSPQRPALAMAWGLRRRTVWYQTRPIAVQARKT